MKRRFGWLVVVCCSLGLSLGAKSKCEAKNWSAAADSACKVWVAERFSGENGFPFSFRYGGRTSDEMLGSWKLKVSTRRIDECRESEVRRYTDPESGLEVRCEIVRYTDYPAVEWVVWLRNGGRAETDIIEDIRTLDAPVGLDGSDRVYINYNIGGSSGAQGIQGIQEFQPYRVRLAKRDSIVKGAFWAGFPTALNLPFFNAEWITDSGTQGMIAAVGWPARWKASFDRTLDSALTVRVGQIRTRLRLKPGEEMTVDDLLKAVAVQSANDATVCLAEYVAGSEEAFVQLMNQKAAELGMENTNFACCAGLDNEGHYSTARDIALMSRALLRYPKITDYTTIWMDTLRNGATSLVNTNRLVRFYQGATGLKTGTTNGAGCCLSASASRDGLGLIAVVLGAGNSNDRFAPTWPR